MSVAYVKCANVLYKPPLLNPWLPPPPRCCCCQIFAGHLNFFPYYTIIKIHTNASPCKDQRWTHSHSTLIGASVYLLIYSANLGAAAQCINASQELQLMSTSIIRIDRRSDLCGFNHGIVVGSRWADLSSSETASHLGVSYCILYMFNTNYSLGLVLSASSHPNVFLFLSQLKNFLIAIYSQFLRSLVSFRKFTLVLSCY